MSGIVKLLGIVILVAGVVYFLKPNMIKKAMFYFLDETRLKITGIVLILLGAILMRIGPRCSVPWFVIVFGFIVLVKGVLTFVIEKNKIKKMADWFLSKPTKVMRKYVLIDVVIGAALIFAA